MRIVMLSALETVGGAAIAASRLAEALIRAGVEVVRIVGRPGEGRYPRTTRVLQVSPLERTLIQAARKVSKSLETRLATWVSRRRAKDLLRDLEDLLHELRPDIMNLHNLHGTVWPPEFAVVCARHGPIVWTLHDMWSFTGRCGYSYDCRKFISGCDASCPTPMEHPALEPRLIEGAWRLRRRLLADRPDMVAVCPSRWLAREARAGLWAGHRVEVIPYGLPLDVYQPCERAQARSALGIPSQGWVLLAVAQSFMMRRKGGAILNEALEKVHHRPLTLLTLGHGHLPVTAKGVRVHPLGQRDDKQTIVFAYNAADLLVHSALADNLPNVVLEAIACGTPCVGFPVGGVADMVRPGLTGWLAEEVSASALAAAIDEALAAIEQGVALRSSCRAVAEAEYAAPLQARRYLALFESLQCG